MDLQGLNQWAPHCVVLLLMLLSQWSVDCAWSDLPSPLVMQMVIDGTPVPAPLQWTGKPLNIKILQIVR